MKMKVILSSIVALLVLCPLLASCTHPFRVYDFVAEESEFPLGVVSARLFGRGRMVNRTVIMGSPYTLTVWIGSRRFLEGTIHISDLKLLHARTRTVVFETTSILEKTIKQDMSSFGVHFAFTNIELGYADMALLIRFSLRSENVLREYSAEIHFERDFKEFGSV